MSASVLSGCQDLSAPREEMDPLFASGLRASKSSSAQLSLGKASPLRVSSLWLVSYYYHWEHVLGSQVLGCLFHYVTFRYQEKKNDWGQAELRINRQRASVDPKAELGREDGMLLSIS